MAVCNWTVNLCCGARFNELFSNAFPSHENGSNKSAAEQDVCRPHGAHIEIAKISGDSLFEKSPFLDILHNNMRSLAFLAIQRGQSFAGRDNQVCQITVRLLVVYFATKGIKIL
jgi:hypothetical protein